MGTLYELADSDIFDALPGYGFTVVPNDVACDEFTRLMRDFIRRICRKYEDDIDRQMQKPNSGKRREDYISWSYSELYKIIHEALHKYRDKIIDGEMILLERQRILCDRATMYFNHFRVEVLEAKRRSDESNAIQPNGEKYRRKRASRSWTPYMVDFD